MDSQRIKAVAKVLILSTLLPIVDMCTDLYTCISLYVDGNPIWGTLVLSFMWTPSILFFLNQKFLSERANYPISISSKPKSLWSMLTMTILWPIYSISVIVVNFYMFATGQHAEYDETKIVEEIKIAETGFESAPQAVMQLYLAFSAGKRETRVDAAQLFKEFSIAMSITSLTVSSMKINDSQKIESGMQKNMILRSFHTFSTTMASLVLWAAMAYFLDAWVILAFIICYVLTFLGNVLIQKVGEEENVFKGEINWFGMPPFYWLTAYIIGFCLPKREKTCSIVGTAITLGIFAILIQKCVIYVQHEKYSDGNSTYNGTCTSQEFSDDTLVLWTPFMFVGLWLLIDLCTLATSTGWIKLEFFAQILFSLLLILVILTMV